MSNIIKHYDCWGVPYAIWRNEENGEYLCGVYDVGLGSYVGAGSMDTVLWDGFEITPAEAASLVNKYTENVLYRDLRLSGSFRVKPNVYKKMESDIKNNREKGGYNDIPTR